MEDSQKKEKKKETRQQLQQDVGDKTAVCDDNEQDMQTVDFDVLIETLKTEKKLIEIRIPQSGTVTNQSKVCASDEAHIWSRTAV